MSLVSYIMTSVKRLFISSKQLVERYERHLSSAALVGGFIIDSLTLRRIDFLFENLILISYLVLSGLGIFLLNVYEGGRLRGPLFDRLHRILPLVIQFAFGGLFSGFLIFYYRSSSIAASWFFIVLLIALFIGNEAVKKYYQRTVFQLSVYFFSLFLFLIFYVPVLVGRMGDGIFFASGLAALLIISLFLFALNTIIPVRMRDSRTYTVWCIAGVYLAVNILYVTHIIPPIPLSLKDVGMYHSVVRVPGGYSVTREKGEGTGFLSMDNTVHLAPDQPLYAYSSIFAPTRLNTGIVHHWQRYDERQKLWLSVSRISFPITGGRDSGYRGYSQKSALPSGEWRIDIETAQGQQLGRIKFRIETVELTPELETVVL